MKVKKKSVEGLHTSLREIEGAGFVENKKEKNVNRRAGLRDKKAGTGEARIKRRKPLTLKHIRRGKRIAMTTLSCVCVGALGIVGAGFFMNKDNSTTDKIFNTVCYETPADGSLPTQHTLIENIGYLNYTLQNQEWWSSEMASTVNAAGFKQNVQNYKQYYEGILISVDIAEGFSQKANQFCVVKDEGVVLWRPSATKKFDGINTKWSEGSAEGCTIDEFREKRGFPPSEFSVYVLNENTVLNASDYSVTDNGDGTFAMTIELSVGADDEHSADYYYRQQMMITGDLSTKPVITKTSVTYVFNASWQVLSFKIQDEYIALGGVHCSSETNTKFDYSKEKAENTFYNDYFKQYEHNFVKNDQPVNTAPKPLDYITAAFTPVLQGGAVLNLDLKFDGLTLDGAAYVELDDGALSDVRIALGDILVLIGGDNELYVSDGNAKYKLDIGGLLSSESAEVSEEESAQGTAAGLDTAALIDQLTGGEFTVTENSACLKSTLSLFGLDISLTFDFAVAEGGKIDLGYISAEIPFNGKTISARAQYGSESDIPAKPDDLSDYRDILNEGITLDVSLSLEEFKLDGFVSVLMNGGAFEGVNAQLGEMGVFYDCPRNMLYLTDGNAKYLVDLSKVSADGADVSSLVGGLNIDGLLAQILNNLSAGEGKISTLATLEILEQTVTAALGVKLTGGIAVDAAVTLAGKTLNLTAGLSNEAASRPDLSGYVDVLNEGITLDVALGLDEIALAGKVFVGFENGKFTTLKADFGEIKVHYYGGESSLYIAAGTTKILVPLNDSEQGRVDFLGALGGLSPKICDLLGNLTTGLKSISLNPEIKLLDSSVFANIKLDIENGVKLDADVTLLGIPVTLSANFTENTLGDIAKDEYINVFENVWAVVDNILTDNVALTVNGQLTNVEDNSVAYAFDAAVEYDKGETLAQTYIRFNLALTAGAEDKDDLYLEIYLLDANPVAGENGFTAGGYTTDGELDVFVRVSKFAEGAEGYAPLQFYAPVREVLTLVSIAGALVDLDELEFKDSEELTNAVAEISKLLDEMLISKYLPATKDQFTALGESLIPQILGKSLGEFLNELLAPILGAATAIPDTAEGLAFDLNAEYIKKVSYGEEGFNLVLNSGLLYGAAGLDDTSAEVLFKDIEGVNFLSDIRVNNVYVGGNAQKLDLSAGLNYGAVARIAAENAFKDYRNFDGVDTLIKALVNSATHSKENATDREIEISGLENLPDYILNHYYYIDGHLAVELNIVDLVKPTVNLDIVALSITIDEVTNEVAVNVRLHYKELTAEAMGAKYIAINGESYVDLTIKGGMLYIKRTQVNSLIIEKSGWGGFLDGIVSIFGVDLDATKGKTEACNIVTYRAYELKSISSDIADILGLVGYIFNLNDKLVTMINNNIAGQDTSNETNTKVDYSGLDYGALLAKYLDSFVYSDDGAGSASWRVAISGGFITDMLGMTTTSPVITFNADYVTDENGAKVYTVQGLNIEPLTIKFLESVNISMTAYGAFEYCNPQLEMKDGKTDVTSDCAPIWEEIFGCGSADITKTELWAKALQKSGTNYLTVSPDGAVRLGELKYTLEGNAVADGGKVLYGLDGVLSDVTYPVWTQKNGYSVVTSFDAQSVTVNAEYAPNTYGVKICDGKGVLPETLDYVYGFDLDLGNYIDSKGAEGDKAYFLKGFKIDGKAYSGVIPFEELKLIYCSEVTVETVWQEAIYVNFTSAVPFGYDGTQYEGICRIDADADYGYTFIDGVAEGYIFQGWWYNDGAAWSKLASVEAFEAGETVTVEALWLKVTLNFNQCSRKYNFDWKRTYTYTINIDFSVEFVGNSEITSKIIVSDYTLISFANGDANITGTGNTLKTETGTLECGLTYKGIDLSGTKQDLNKKYANVRLDFGYTYVNELGETYESGTIMNHISKDVS